MLDDSEECCSRIQEEIQKEFQKIEAIQDPSAKRQLCYKINNTIKEYLLEFNSLEKIHNFKNLYDITGYLKHTYLEVSKISSRKDEDIQLPSTNFFNLIKNNFFTVDKESGLIQKRDGV